MWEKVQPFKTVATNVVVTFFQAAFAVMAVNNWDFTDKTVLAGAAGAGASVVWNTVIKPWIKLHTSLYAK